MIRHGGVHPRAPVYAEAMRAATVELGDAEAGAVFGPGGLESPHRYALHRRWAPGPTMLALMLNPSTATHEQLDPTISRMVRRAAGLGFGRLQVANLYALRSTDPAALRAHPDPVGPWNDAAILAQARAADVIVAGWGAHATPDRALYVASLLRAADLELLCLGTTAAGAPRHPLYLRYDTPLRPWP